jgi:hypothetical protein
VEFTAGWDLDDEHGRDEFIKVKITAAKWL